MNFRRSDRPGDRAASERLLDVARAGAPPADDADPLAHLLAAAAAPARPGELAGEQAALAAFRAARAGTVTPAAPPRRRRGITTGVVAWVGGIAATATAGAAFAAVTLDRPAEQQPPPPSSVPAPIPPDDRPGKSTPSTGTRTSGAPSDAPVAPPSAGATSGVPKKPGRPDRPDRPAPDGKLAGLCRAYLAKPVGKRDKSLTTPAYADLVAAAGGAERVEAYCRGLLPDRAPAGPRADPSSRPAPPPVAADPDARPSGRS